MSGTLVAVALLLGLAVTTACFFALRALSKGCASTSTATRTQRFHDEDDAATPRRPGDGGTSGREKKKRGGKKRAPARGAPVWDDDEETDPL